LILFVVSRNQHFWFFACIFNGVVDKIVNDVGEMQ
jgi:hypothetical protein